MQVVLDTFILGQQCNFTISFFKLFEGTVIILFYQTLVSFGCEACGLATTSACTFSTLEFYCGTTRQVEFCCNQRGHTCGIAVSPRDPRHSSALAPFIFPSNTFAFFNASTTGSRIIQFALSSSPYFSACCKSSLATFLLDT